VKNGGDIHRFSIIASFDDYEVNEEGPHSKTGHPFKPEKSMLSDLLGKLRERLPACDDFSAGRSRIGTVKTFCDDEFDRLGRHHSPPSASHHGAAGGFGMSRH